MKRGKKDSSRLKGPAKPAKKGYKPGFKEKLKRAARIAVVSGQLAAVAAGVKGDVSRVPMSVPSLSFPPAQSITLSKQELSRYRARSRLSAQELSSLRAEIDKVVSGRGKPNWSFILGCVGSERYLNFERAYSSHKSRSVYLIDMLERGLEMDITESQRKLLVERRDRLRELVSSGTFSRVMDEWFKKAVLASATNSRVPDPPFLKDFESALNAVHSIFPPENYVRH